MPLPVSQTIPLPEALLPWQTWLMGFDPELLPALSALLQRLNRILGPVQGRQLGGLPEQDGLGQIQNKGEYQNLLLSEWLMADEVPDEFIRRAINGEHLFLAPNYKNHQSLNQITVLFDSGPLQLGASRLAHIALMILLAQRAEKAGCTFKWGTLQSDAPLETLSDTNAIQKLLKRRTYSPVLSIHIAHWQNVIEQDVDIQQGELWLVTSVQQRTHFRAIPFTHHVTLSHDETHNKTIDTHVYTPQHRRHLSLPIPNENLSLRLLNGILRTRSVKNTYNSEHRISLMVPPAISFHGSTVAVKLLEKPGFMLVRIPSLSRNQKESKSPEKISIKCQIFPENHTVLSLQCHGKIIGALLANTNGLYFWQLSDASGYIAYPPKYVFSVDIGRNNHLQSALLICRGKTGFFVLDRNKRLVFFTPRNKEKPYQVIQENVLGLEKIADNVLVYIYLDMSEFHQGIIDVSLSAKHSYLHFSETKSNKYNTMFAYRHRYTDGTQQISCAISHDVTLGHWHIYNMSVDPYKGYNVKLPSGWQGIGLFYSHSQSEIEDLNSLNILMLSQNKKNIACYLDGEIETLYSTTVPIARYSFSPKTGLFSAITQDKQLIVYDVYRKQLRLSLHSIEQNEGVNYA